MRVIDRMRVCDTTVRWPVKRCSCVSGAVEQHREIQVEHELDVFVEGEKLMTIVCTPEQMAELVAGRLLTEGLVESPGDLEEVRLSGDGSAAWVSLRDGVRLRNGGGRLVPTYGSGDRLYAGSPSAVARSPLPKPPAKWSPAWIYALADRFGADTPMHKKTHGAHSCYLAVRGRLLYCCEDLGRHNALDKAVGCALRDGVALDEAVLYTSGRVPVDMLRKALRAGISVVVSNAMPTDRAVRMAIDHDITLICRARPDSMLVFSDPACVCGCNPTRGEGFEVLRSAIAAS